MLLLLVLAELKSFDYTSFCVGKTEKSCNRFVACVNLRIPREAGYSFVLRTGSDEMGSLAFVNRIGKYCVSDTKYPNQTLNHLVTLPRYLTAWKKE